MANVIETVGLTRRYGSRRGVTELSFAVAEGEVFGFLGPNGAGKTTTIRLLLGTLRPTAGNARVFGFDTWSEAPAVHRHLAYLGSDPGFLGELTVAEQLDYLAGLRGLPKQVWQPLAERLELDRSVQIRRLSRGNRQKVGVIAATDGLAWQRTPSSGAFAGPAVRVKTVAHWSGGFVAAGYQGPDSGIANAAFWVSPDGLSWQRAPDSPALQDARASAIAAGGPGLVAVGTSASADPSSSAVVWMSVDGLHWSRLAANQAFGDGGMDALANVPGVGLVAAGENSAGTSGIVWISTDGVSWTREPGGPDLGGPGSRVRMEAVAGGGPRIVVAGFASSGVDAQYGDAAVWASADGRVWRRQPSGAEFVAGEIAALVPWRSGFIAVGDTGAPDDFGATVWQSPEEWTH